MCNIETKVGDFLSSNVKMKVHQVNCQGTMDYGISKSVKEHYPELYREYSKICKEVKDEQLFGNAQFVECEDGVIFVNLFSQLDFSEDGLIYTNYDALKSALKQVKWFVTFVVPHSSVMEIAFPYHMGCGLGGAEWVAIKRTIASVFDDWEGNVVFYKL